MLSLAVNDTGNVIKPFFWSVHLRVAQASIVDLTKTELEDFLTAVSPAGNFL